MKKIIISTLLICIIFLSYQYFSQRVIETKKGVPIKEEFTEDNGSSKPVLTDEIIQEIANPIYDAIYSLIPGQTGSSFQYSKSDTKYFGNIGNYKYSIGVTRPIEESDPEIYSSTLLITNGNKKIFSRQYDKFTPIYTSEIKTKNQTTRIIEIFTFGAHCCVSLIPITTKNNQIYVGEPLDVRNTDVINKSHFFVQDGKLYKIIFDDRFAYYETSFAGSKDMFYPLIYLIDEKGFTPVPGQFKDYYKKLYQVINTQTTKLLTYKVEDEFNEYIIASSILRYSIGYLAGYDRQQLKKDLLLVRTTNPLDEKEIFDIVSEKFGRDLPNPISKQNNPVVNYAKVKRISTSGDARFYWYDTDTKLIKNPDDQYAWFFALPPFVPYNEITTNNWVKFINDNIDSVFKISGTKGKDDCDYWDPDHCVENIDIKMIEVVGKNLKMEF